MPVGRRVLITACMALGMLLVQAAWILTMPPFGAVDEFDHAFRASSVASGEFFTQRGRPEEGRGLLVTVDEDIALAAEPQCAWLTYTGTDNCNPVEQVGDGKVTIASSAAIYQPTYYSVVGWVASVLDGSTALYGMRVVSSLVIAALWAASVWILTGWARSPWPLVAATVSVTPTVAYSFAVLAPNGLEIALAILLWVSLIGTTRVTDDARTRRLLVTGATAATAFAWVRPFSPVWLFFVILAWAVLLGPSGIRRLVTRHPRVMVLGVTSVALSALSSAGWVLTHETGEPPRGYDLDGSVWGETLMQVPLWFFQTISGVPFRDDAAPSVVYVAGFVLMAFTLGALTVRSSPGLRLSALVTFSASLGVALWYTQSRLPTAGPLWQGRYSWCLAVGVVLLAGLALEQRPFRRLKRLGVLFGAPALLTMHVVCVLSVLDMQQAQSPLSGEPAWVTAPGPVVGGLMGLGVCAWMLALLVTAHAVSGNSTSPAAIVTKVNAMRSRR